MNRRSLEADVDEPAANGQNPRARRAGVVLTIVVALAIVVPSCGAGIVALVNSAMKSTDVYRLSLQRVRAHDLAKAAFGVPIEDGYLPSGSIHVGGGQAGTATLDIPLSGPRGDGHVLVDAKQVGPSWVFSKLYVIAPGGRGIDLIGPNLVR